MQTIKGFLNKLKGLLSKDDEIIEEQKLPELSAQNFIGAICQVLSTETSDCFTGRIVGYSSHENLLKISGYRIDKIPLWVGYYATIKIQIEKDTQLTLIYVNTKKQSKEHLWAAVEKIEQYSEQRKSFRQPLNGTSTLLRCVQGKAEEIACKLIDISSTGICVCCEANLEIDEQIMIQDVCLYPNSPNSYTFECTVKRVFIRGQNNNQNTNPNENESAAVSNQNPKDIIEEIEEDQLVEKYYGCSFQNISSEAEERLCRDIFHIQQEQRKHQ